jgi:hypothetical protein
MEQELQKIYDSEINVTITWFWDGGVDVKLGDDLNGYEAEGQVKTIAEVVPWLQQAIAKHYPRSAYNLNRLKEAGKDARIIEFPSNGSSEGSAGLLGVLSAHSRSWVKLTVCLPLFVMTSNKPSAGPPFHSTLRNVSSPAAAAS